MQQTNLGNTSDCFENYLDRLPSVGIDGESVPINSLTLANLDIALFRCLRKIGSSRERICSALFLSYAEYDYILRHMQELDNL